MVLYYGRTKDARSTRREPPCLRAAKGGLRATSSGGLPETCAGRSHRRDVQRRPDARGGSMCSRGRSLFAPGKVSCPSLLLRPRYSGSSTWISARPERPDLFSYRRSKGQTALRRRQPLPSRDRDGDPAPVVDPEGVRSRRKVQSDEVPTPWYVPYVVLWISRTTG